MVFIRQFNGSNDAFQSNDNGSAEFYLVFVVVVVL